METTKQIEEPLIYLNPNESLGRADCGCVLDENFQNSGNCAFVQCDMHKAARALLEALKNVLRAPCIESYVSASSVLIQNYRLQEIKDAIAKAEGGAR